MKEKLLSLVLGALLTFLTIDYFMHRAEMRGCQMGVAGFITVMAYNSTGQVIQVPEEKTKLICVDLLRGNHE